MIKLKDLIKEVKPGEGQPKKFPTYRFDTKPGTPDQVIKVNRLVVAELMKKGLNPKEYVGIYHEPEDPNVEEDPNQGTWMLINKRHMKKTLIYMPINNTWNLPLGVGGKMKPVSKKSLKTLIQTWA